ncbi:M1 family metallopeptidase [Sphingomonas sp. A2-49]|uniref:M1 family metallopeptidase n=1 Tax=Sphingomonas sp. A2-49 TaxID=1391375 RepID=UPI0021CE0D4E|nr:M1 family metallopeptidase [Sphingomonas sp. A2-49]MCU6452790.1 M1 family metallopeptidase [Sphingomonas sp. A2-49]
MKIAVVAALALTVSTPALAAGSLPTTVLPVVYDIAVTPDAQAMTFTGSETVTVDVKAATATITLNAADLAIAAATFDGKPVRFALDKDRQQLVLTLPAAATVGRHSVGFRWSGKINQSAAGLFAIDYTNQDGSKARMLATQFEAPDARRFAPMWDEPAFKAKFRLKAVAPAGQLALSNMPVASVAKQADGTQLYSFAETPVMSSYLLYLGMGDLERKTVQAGNVEIGVVTRRGVVDQGDYALAQARRLLPYYNDYFGQPYPLPKLDMIAGPGSSQFFGAMENWGAIFYFEPELLFDRTRATESGRQRIFTVVAHEMAHQWFGDLVTMRWWDDLWLNEGFASWMENKSAADLNPSWEAAEAAVSSDRESAMGIDATAATHPIIRKIDTVDQIGEAFDGITYAKGQAVIGMLESTLGANTFRDGIRRYMAKYKYGNTVTDQLWAELSAAAGKPVADIARGFTLQGGVPLVTLTGARCTGGTTTATLAQGRFGLDAASKAPQTWQVPLVVGTLGGGETRGIVSGPATTVSVKGCGTLLLNKGKGSYTRVMYDQPAHDALVRDYTRLPLADRLGTLGDDYALAAGGYQDLSRYFALMGRVGAAADPLEWSLVSGRLGSLGALFEGTPLAQPLRARTVAILAPVLQRIGFDAKPGESPLVSNLREGLVGRLGDNGDPEVLRKARDYVGQLATNPTAIPPAIRQPILSTYASNATAADWQRLLALTKAETNPVAKNRYVSLLGAAEDEGVARQALALLTGEGILTAPQKASLLRAVAGSHPDMAFDWAVANRKLVDGFIEESSRSGYIVTLGAGSTDPAMPAKIEAFAQTLPETSRGPAKRVLSGIAVRKAAADRLRPAVQTWLGATR